MKQDIKKWESLDKEYLYCDEPWLTVVREKMQLPNGNIIDNYYSFEYPDWVNVIAITKEGKFVLVRQYRHGLGEVNFELCAGVCEEEDKSPMETAQRELMEETGYGGGEWSLMMTCSCNPGTHNNMVHNFVARGVGKINEQNLEDTEDISVHLLSLEEMKELLTKNEIKQSVMAAPLWRYISEINNQK